ncbi:MAG: prepilin-type N-terminal cleavage/methylation domain-containing protein [Phycisphaerae bacterium]|jgi:prepilin-type N-terminal cleavage/methylation domain-containing protein
MRRKGFTLVELLVVIGIIAVLMGVLLPTLNTVKRTAQRVVCGSNQASVGKAMLLYANDHDGEFPKAGGAGARWGTSGKILNWKSTTAMATTYWGPPPASVTITSSLYLLIKYADLTPSQFVCKGDAGTKEFKLSDCTSIPPNIDDVTDVWDFGDGTTGTSWPGQYNSYAYHNPYENTTINRSFPIGSYNDSATPVLADRNLYLDKNADVYKDGSTIGETAPGWLNNAYSDPYRTGNSAAHQREGQNVLFVDAHVTFAKFPNVGISKDNIWKCWTSAPPPEPDAKNKEVLPTPYKTILQNDGTGAPMSERDAYLVSESNKR